MGFGTTTDRNVIPVIGAPVAGISWRLPARIAELLGVIPWAAGWAGPAGIGGARILLLAVVLAALGELCIPLVGWGEHPAAEAVAAASVPLHAHLLSEIELGWAPAAAVFLLAQLPLLLVILLQEHRRRTERSRSLVEDPIGLATTFANIGFWRWDAGTDCLSATEHCRRLTGFAMNESLTGASFLSAVHPDDRALVSRNVDRALREGCPCESEYRVLLPDGTIRWIAARGRPIRSRSRRSVGLAGIAVDITRQKQDALEAERRQQELAHLTRVTTLDGLSGAFAHELNQPLTAILSNAQAAQRLITRQPLDTIALEEILADIVDDDNRAATIIQRLRSLLKKGDPTKRPLDLNELVNEVNELARSDFIERQVAIATHFTENLPPVFGDRVQLQQVVLNLVVNACESLEMQHLPRQIVISTECRKRRWIQLSISDNGGGISDEILDRVFEPFVTTKLHGLGLGLSICRSIVTAHGGTLRATNNPIRGTTIRLRLPASTGDES
jgi:PAS domain S-box-containing protein